MHRNCTPGTTGFGGGNRVRTCFHQFSKSVSHLRTNRVEPAGENVLLGFSEPQVQRIVWARFREARPNEFDGSRERYLVTFQTLVGLFRAVQGKGFVEQVAVRGQGEFDVSRLDQELSNLFGQRRQLCLAAIIRGLDLTQVALANVN